MAAISLLPGFAKGEKPYDKNMTLLPFCSAI